ncbi:chemotaxis protein CheW [Polynucleobacter sp. AP-Reno-20A-A9]|uniref:chemotaxis protein CheW n=1 Tax=Polynucleobacter sp. AP-Reno-20A-A9 TaxID=2576925 RepID=UPI001C0E0C5B|nr:chemotaxis protein CheW [Polynucleobacter sp. AP-Reno-20A-A9]MBU3629096.1 chemotaxis protein CheW [Polynucleobacter sp. AP-Reno-20A-A9]
MPSFLVFESESVQYAIPAESVESISWLPELSPIEAAPPWFIGLANWHGEVVHVLDLGLRFKHQPRAYSTTTNIILVSTPQMRCGLIADSVRGLAEVSSEAIVKRELTVPSDFNVAYSDLIEGEIKQGDDIILMLNLQKLLTVQIGHERISDGDEPPYEPVNLIAKHDEVIFRARMHHLALPMIDHKNENQDGFALVMIGGIRYAIEISYITEFTHLKQCVSLPCCPSYILGVINLRGEILSVIDMTSLLNIQNIVDKQDIVILQFESKRIALAVQKVEDLRYFDRHLISTLQDAEENHARCKSLLRVDEGVAGILDIEAILLGSLLEVDEQV